jgi:hypothetical protein
MTRRRRSPRQAVRVVRDFPQLSNLVLTGDLWEHAHYAHCHPDSLPCGAWLAGTATLSRHTARDKSDTHVRERVRLSHGLVAEIHRRQPDWDDQPIPIPTLPTDYDKATA